MAYGVFVFFWIKMKEEVNDRLQDQGHVTIPELTKLYDLPADFLSEVI
jgi:hypothetical protein